MKKQILLSILACLPLLASADTVEIDGILYNLVKKVKTAEVTRNPDDNYYYSGAIDIPAKVTYEEIEYDVTSIGASAFYFCSALTSITIPNSVTSIGSGAFAYSRLQSITIPNSLKSIGENAFNAPDLTYVHITDIEAWCNIEFSGYLSNPLHKAHKLYLNGTELIDLVIPNSVTTIGHYAFYNCSGLTSVTIPNSVTSIGQSAFWDCSGLSSVTIPNSVTSIGQSAFKGCIGLTSITIPNSVTYIGDDAFYNCSGITSIVVDEENSKYDSRYHCNALIESETNILLKGCNNTAISNSVIGIRKNAFYGCSGITSIAIPNSVTFVSDRAFAECPELTDVTCLAENVPSTSSNVFEGSYIEYATLHVPAGAVDAYKSTEPWSNFNSIVPVDGGEIPETPKCATPTITYKDGKITFSCATEGVEYVSTITASDTKSYFAGEITLTNKYTVSVYATKDGYDKSDTATMDIIGSAGAFGDLNEDGEVNVADHVELSDIILKRKH